MGPGTWYLIWCLVIRQSDICQTDNEQSILKQIFTSRTIFRIWKQNNTSNMMSFFRKTISDRRMTLAEWHLWRMTRHYDIRQNDHQENSINQTDIQHLTEWHCTWLTFDRMTFDRMTFNRMTFNRKTFNRMTFNRLTFNRHSENNQ